MAVFDERQINRMRQEAIRRSQEMHSRAAVGPSRSENAEYHDPGGPPQPPADIREPERKDEPKKNILSGLLGDIFGGGLDSDKLLIAALLILMIKEGADIKLILALGYILL